MAETKYTFVRHAEPDKIAKYNPGLTIEGITAASELTGHFDLVICSPMERCLQTLSKSQITYEEMMISPLMQERRFAGRDDLHLMPPALQESYTESDEYFFGRVKEFTRLMNMIDRVYAGKSILLIGHAYFFNCWYMRACCEAPKYGTFIPGDREKVLSMPR
jgi:broad specificity phosphatase PhoE